MEKNYVHQESRNMAIVLVNNLEPIFLTAAPVIALSLERKEQTNNETKTTTHGNIMLWIGLMNFNKLVRIFSFYC
jgi:hypothetical protein